MPFAIRDFHKDDFETLWGIDQRCFAPGISYSRLELAAYVNLAGSFTLVAEMVPENGTELKSTSSPLGVSESRVPREQPQSREVVGFVVANAGRGAGHIITIDVLPKAQRFGVGSGLLSTAEERLRASRCTFVKLETAVNNVSALSFYKRHKYFLVRTLPRYYPDGSNAFVLRKELLSSQRDR